MAEKAYLIDLEKLFVIVFLIMDNSPFERETKSNQHENVQQSQALIACCDPVEHIRPLRVSNVCNAVSIG